MKQRASRNRTLTCSPQEVEQFKRGLVTIEQDADLRDVTNAIVHQDMVAVAPHLPKQFVDVLVLDPPYNLSKTYNELVVKEKRQDEYQQWFAQVIQLLKPTLKPTATVYVCADWKTSLVIAPVLEAAFHIRNRITWEREKGRGAKTNWKNSSEDIWFCTLSDQYTFNVDAVKIKRKVIAPYRTPDGKPKDWDEEESGNFRLTYPSNVWTDITVPFWSMPENTDHPTQKPEKLIAKLVLASSHAGDMVFDPFLGSGTTAVVAMKLGRQFLGVEIDQEYCCWAMKRLNRAKEDPTIQGYRNKVFWERNTSNDQAKHKQA